MLTGQWYIFGAKSTAIGLIRALRANCPQCEIMGCVVSSLMDNPSEIENIKVVELKDFACRIPEEEKGKIQILIATPIYVQGEIRDTLKMFGFSNVKELDTQMEAEVMAGYFKTVGGFPLLKDIRGEVTMPKTRVLAVKHHKDKVLTRCYENEAWVEEIQVGAVNTDKRLASVLDSMGDNISEKNSLYCELTALYWMWKNMLHDGNDYYGLFHYRRILDITDDDLKHCAACDIDAILPFPMIHTPDIKEHHARYANEQEWDMLLKVVEELSPEYMADYERIFSQQYMYNYNMFVSKGRVVSDYCEWLFPILFRTEELCERDNVPFTNRYIAYFGESLFTWYIMHHAEKLKLVHTGRILRE